MEKEGERKTDREREGNREGERRKEREIYGFSQMNPGRWGW